MNPSTFSKAVLCFGAFEIDLDARQLRKHGVKRRLQEQPFQVLTFLLERRGQIVAREELRQKLWPAETFVDFDHGLNNAVNRLREALNDSADAPRFIETLPRRGYRFIAPVRAAQVLPVLSQLPHGTAEICSDDRIGYPSIDPSPVRPWERWLLLTAITTLLCVVIIASLIQTRPLPAHSPAPVQRPSIAVLPFSNLSGDPGQDYFVDGMTAQLITDLAKTGSLRVVSRRSAIQYKGTRKGTAQIARELNVQSVVEGEVLRSASQVRITAQLIEASTEKHLWAETYLRDMRDILDLQSEIAASVAEVIRVHLASAGQKHFHLLE